MDDITKVLAYEIKKDIANRYFGFRKQIETESKQYLKSLEEADKQYLTGIKTDLQRMQCLLAKEDIFHSFLAYIGMPDSIADISSPSDARQWRTLFEGLKGQGFTRWRRYRNLVYQVYSSLIVNIDHYREIFTKLSEEHEELCAEIDRFSRKNDLSGILTFLREIDNPDGPQSAVLRADSAGLAGGSMEQDLRIVPPPPVTTGMYALPQLPSLATAKPTLKDLAGRAFALLDPLDSKELPF